MRVSRATEVCGRHSALLSCHTIRTNFFHMQRSPQEIKDKLLEALDSDYNVIDMPVVVEIIGLLEHTTITREVLEATRLGKYINELRRKTRHEGVAKRAKDLVRKWRHLIVPDTVAVAPGSNGVRPLQNRLPLRTGHLSPGLPARLSQPSSPSSRVSSLSPESKLTFSPGVSPAISPRLAGYLPLPAAAVSRVATPASPADSASQAPPQKSPPPRQRGRPPKKNKHKRPLSPAQTTDLVPKTSPANKRLRKNSPQKESVHANGVCPTKLPVATVSEVPSDPKKLRSKSSRNSRHEDDYLVKDTMISLVRTPKVKTTRELLKSIQQESSLDTLRSKTLSSLGVSKPEKLDKPSGSSAGTEHIHKFLRSSQNEISLSKPRKEPRVEVKPSKAATPAAPPPRPATPPSPSGSEIIDVEKVSGCEETPEKPLLPPVKPPPRLETVEEILAQLPHINSDEILWSNSDSESEVEDVPIEITPRDIERLHSEHLEGVNGNRSDGVASRGPEEAPHGLRVSLDPSLGASAPTCQDDCDFREWHETLSRFSYSDDLLHILPYVIID